MSASSSGNGYRLVAADGGIFAFGDASFLGSLGNTQLEAHIAGIAGRPASYRLVGADGSIYPFVGSKPVAQITAVRATSIGGCGHAASTPFGPVAHCNARNGDTEQSRVVSTVSCKYSVDGAQPVASSAAPYVGPSVSEDGTGTFEFFGGPQVATTFGAVSFGEQRWNGFGPLVRWGNFNFVTNRFYASSAWMADLGPVNCEGLTPAP